MEFIDKEDRLLRPKNLFEPAPGKGFQIYKTKNDIKIGVLNLMGNVFMKKCENVFEASQKFLKENEMKKDFDLLVVDFHGEITSEKNAIGHLFDGKATLVVGTILIFQQMMPEYLIMALDIKPMQVCVEIMIQ